MTAREARVEEDFACFGFYGGEEAAACRMCPAGRRCKAVLISHGFTVLGDVVDQMLMELPSGLYRDTDRLSELVEQMKKLPPVLQAEEAELLGMLRGAEGAGILPEDIEI